jgi:hypothetical protein
MKLIKPLLVAFAFFQFQVSEAVELDWAEPGLPPLIFCTRDRNIYELRDGKLKVCFTVAQEESHQRSTIGAICAAKDGSIYFTNPINSKEICKVENGSTKLVYKLPSNLGIVVRDVFVDSNGSLLFSSVTERYDGLTVFKIVEGNAQPVVRIPNRVRDQKGEVFPRNFGWGQFNIDSSGVMRVSIGNYHTHPESRPKIALFYIFHDNKLKPMFEGAMEGWRGHAYGFDLDAKGRVFYVDGYNLYVLGPDSNSAKGPRKVASFRVPKGEAPHGLSDVALLPK